MSLRKVAGLLAALGLAVGMLGNGIGAAFTDQVTAAEYVNVGTFGCKITAATQGTIATDGKSLVYTVSSKIMSDLPGSRPFSFTVKNVGSIPMVLTVSQTALAAPFSSILADPVTPVTLAGAETHAYDAGIGWAELGNADKNKTVSVTYTVGCNPVPVE